MTITTTDHGVCALCGQEPYHRLHIPGQGKNHEFTPMERKESAMTEEQMQEHVSNILGSTYTKLPNAPQLSGITASRAVVDADTARRILENGRQTTNERKTAEAIVDEAIRESEAHITAMYPGVPHHDKLVSADAMGRLQVGIQNLIHQRNELLAENARLRERVEHLEREGRWTEGS